MDKILHQLKNPGMMDFPVSTNKQWFQLQSWFLRRCEWILSIHSSLACREAITSKLAAAKIVLPQNVVTPLFSGVLSASQRTNRNTKAGAQQTQRDTSPRCAVKNPATRIESRRQWPASAWGELPSPGAAFESLEWIPTCCDLLRSHLRIDRI